MAKPSGIMSARDMALSKLIVLKFSPPFDLRQVWPYSPVNR
jgi:hypothetical protein